MEAPLDFRRPEPKVVRPRSWLQQYLEDCLKPREQELADLRQRRAELLKDNPLSFRQQLSQRSFLKEESLEDVLKQLVQDRPGLLRRLRVKRVGLEDFPLSLKEQYSKMLMDEDFLKDFCKELEQYREDPEPSRVSMKSDWSMDHPLSFKQQHSKPEQDRADPPEPSRVSMKSDGYKDFLIDFKRTEQDRADSPEPSCVSMKSDRSMNNPLSFKQQHSKVQQDTSDVSTGRRSPLDSTFMFLEENIVGFVKKELKKFKDMLSPDYPECPEDQCEDEGVVDEDEAQRRYGSALVLKMTLLFMKRMNLGELADSLEKRSVRLLDSVAESKLHNGAFTGLMSAVNMLFSTCFR